MNRYLYLIYFGIIVLLTCCSEVTTKSISSPTYIKYNYFNTGNFSLPKNNSADILHAPLIIGDSVYIYYSKYTDSLTFYNSKSKVIKNYKILEDKNIAESVGYYLLDSNIIVYYRNSNPYIDNHVFSININSGLKSFNYPITDTSFLISSVVSYDSFNLKPSILYHKNYLGSGSLFFDHKSSSIYLPLLAGSDDSSIQQTHDKVNCIMKVDKGSPSNTYLGINYSLVDTTFKRKYPNNIVNNLFHFAPHIFPINQDNFHISFPITGNFINYNVEADSISIISSFPWFLNQDKKLFSNYETQTMEEVYYFYKPVGSVKSDHFFRKVRIPSYNKQNRLLLGSSESRYLVYSKQNGSLPIGIIDRPIEGYIIGTTASNDIIVCNDKESSIRKDSFIINIYKVYPETIETDPYTPNSGFIVETKDGSYKSYLNTQLNKNSSNLPDTIAILPIYGVCSPCVVKLGIFLETVSNSNQGIKPSILVGTNQFQLNNFLSDYNTDSSLAGLHYDPSSYLLDIMSHPNTFGFFIKTGCKYTFQKIPIDRLNDLFKFLNPNYKMVGEICVPLKHY
jgi:hypothetical protein